MDTNIRALLSAASKLGDEKGAENLHEAFDLMKNVAETRPSIDTPDPFGQDLYVICAEISFQHGKEQMAKDCLKMFFMRTPPTNQFLVRAYLCQAQLMAPSSAENPEQLEKAVVYLVKAISMAKENSRYHFLVYNASVIYWQFSRPFLKPKYRQYLAPSLHQVVKALDDIEDKDYEWRAQLMIALIECHMDAGRKSDASHIATAALSFIKNNVPHLYKKAFGLMIKFQLVESSKFQKDMRTSPELNIYYRICRLKLAIEQREADRDPEEEMCKILSIISNRDFKPDRPDKPVKGGHRARSPRMGSADDRRSPVRPSRGSNRTPSPAMGKKMQADNQDKPFLLLELGRMAMEQNLATVADNCVNLIKDCVHLISDPGFFLEVEFLQSELLVKALGDKKESYQKAYIDIRTQAIKRCDEALTNAVRLGNPNVIQAGCVTQWNLCLPLLQNNLRQSVRRPLTNVALALEDIHSLLIQLRCQVHMELARCEEDIEQIQVAMEHLKKAIALDDGQVYSERIQVLLHRLELRGELYKQPESPEDQAGMIIEQARKSASGTMRMKRSLLVRAGQALAPDAFTLVLESENFDKEVAGGKIQVDEVKTKKKNKENEEGPVTQIKKLAGKAQTFKKNVRKAEGHLRRLGNENDKMRANLWGDLARTARKQEVWDVSRVAARFCLLYDDERWKTEAPLKEKEQEDRSLEKRKSRRNIEKAEDGGDSVAASTEGAVREKTNVSVKGGAKEGGEPSEPTSVLYERDLVRMMAEINFINGEALIHLLRSEGVQLGDRPIPPVDKRKHPKGYVAKKPEEDPDWQEYVDWITSLTEAATSCFLRACTLGQELGESWVVCSGAAYLWNYNNQRLQQDRDQEVVDTLQTLLDGLKKVGHSGHTNLLVDICNSLATGLLQPWQPPYVPKDTVYPQRLASASGGGKDDGDGKASPKRGKPPAAAAGGAASKANSKPTLSISPDATPDIKRAIEVCEYALKITNGDRPQDVVPIAVRHLLLQTWVRAKQMKNEQLGRGLGTEDENDNEGQKPMTRAMVAVETNWLNGNGLMDFKDSPSLQAVCEMVDGCKWSDRLVELQLWSRLAYVAFETKDHAIVTLCANKALYFGDHGTTPKGKRVDPHKYMVEQEMLSFAACLYGQSLVLNTQGKNAIRRQAMQQFLTSARFGRNANNYDLVITACRHYWNASLPLINQPIERELLVEPISMILEYIADVTDKDKYKKKEDDDDSDDEGETPRKKKPIGQEGIPPIENAEDLKLEDAPADIDVLLQEQQPEKQSMATGIIGGPDDDLTLRASLYGVLFQSYADRGEWEAGLRAMDQAIADMPRTNHRLLIFKHLVVVKAKLGLNVGMSIQKFKDESEDYVAHMWRRVALCSKEQLEQLQGYQNAIEALNSPSNEWQKFDYLLEFGQWLYCNEFPLRDALDQLEWGVDILLNMKFETIKKEEKKGKKGKKSAGKEKKGAAAKGGAAPKGGAKKGAEKAKKEAEEAKKAAEEAAAKVEKQPTEEQLGIPVKKEIVIGVLPNNMKLEVWELTDIKQMDGLFRAHSLLAQIAGRDSPHYTHYVLQAVAYVIQMWQVSVSQSGPIVKELAKLSVLKEAEGGDKKGSAKKGKKGKDEPPPKEKPKRKGALDTVPVSVEQWAEYDAPEEVLEAFKTEQMRYQGINASTIPKPSLTLYYLEQLVTQVRQMGHAHLALPLLAMQDVLSRELLKHRPLFALIHLRAMEVCIELNLNQGVAFHQKVADYNMTKEEQAKSREEMALWKERKVQVAKEEQRIKENLASLRKQDSKVMTSKEKELQQKGVKSKASPSKQDLQVRMLLPEDSRLKTMLEQINQRLKARFAVPSDFDFNAADEDDGQGAHLGRKIGAIEFRQVWMDTAEVLLDNALYQPARELLNESLQAARAFEEKELEARVLYLLARLSFYEGQYLQAVTMCMKSQRTFDGDEMFWYDTTMLMVDASMADYELKRKDRFRKARSILVHALNVFQEVAETRPNKTSITGYILSMLETRLGSVQVTIAMKEHDNMLKESVLEALKSATDKLEHGYHHLLRLGYKREASKVMQERAEVFAEIARKQKNLDGRHDYMLRALMELRHAVQVADDVYTDTHTLLPLGELKNLSTPTQRESTEVKLKCAALMLEMYEQHAEELRVKQYENLRKGSTVRALEEYVEEAPTFSTNPVGKNWQENCKVLCDESFVHLEAALSQAGQITDLRAKALYNIGKLLRLLAENKHPDPPKQWHIQEMPMLVMKELSTSISQLKGSTQSLSKQNLLDQRTEKTVESEDEDDEDAKQRRKYQQVVKNLQQKADVAQAYMAQATEVLTQALNISLEHNHKEIAGLTALQLVECFGQLDPGLSSQYLALYQSCAASQELEELLCQALVDPKTSQQAALFHQRANLMLNNISSNRANGPVMKQVIATLEEHSTAWKRLTVLKDHTDLLKELQPNYNLVVLQHSPDKKYLYGAILDKPNPAAAPGDKKGGAGGASKQALRNSKAKIVRVDTSPEEIEELSSRFYWYKHEVMQFLLKMEYQRSMFAQREKMLANLDEKDRSSDNTGSLAGSRATSAKQDNNNPLEEEWAEDERRVSEDFVSLLDAMEQYLRPITAQMDAVLRPPSPTVSSEGQKEKKDGKEKSGREKEPKEPEPPNEYLAILADRTLLEMPLEALQAFHQDNIVALSRDISFQMLYHKLKVEILDEAALKEKKKKDEGKPPSRIPGMRAANKAQAKIIPLDRPVPSGMLPVDTHLFRYMVDAHLDCAETEENKPIEKFKEMLEEHEQQFTPRWLGVYGAEHSASVGEYEIYMNESSAFVFYGFESFLTQLPPYKVASLNFEDCQMVMLFDRVQTNSSFARQSKLDVLKTQEVLTLEKPVETALLLSLSGINAIFSNQWHCTCEENAQKLQLTMQDVLARGKTSGQAARLLMDPVKRMYEIKAEQEAEEAKQQNSKPNVAQQNKGSAKATPAHTPGEEEEEEEEQEEERPVTPEPEMTRSWYNMVCYGLPNLVVTQLSKA